MKSIRHWLRARRWARRALACAVVLFVLLNIISFLVAPPVIRNVAASKLSEALKRPVSIEKVFLNPYALAVTVTGFKIGEPGGGEDFVRFDRLYVNAQMMSLFKLAPIVREVTLERPYVHVVRTAAKQFNFSDLATSGTTPAAPAKPGRPFRFSINGIRVIDGQLRYEDQVVGKKNVVASINVAVPSVSNFPYYIETDVQPTLSATLDGTPVTFSGTTKPFAETMETTLELSVRGLDIPYYLAYSPVQPNCEVKSAKLTVNAVLKYVQSAKGMPYANVTADVTLRHVAVEGKAGEPLFQMPELRLIGARFDYPAMQYGCNRVLIREPDLHVSRGKNGEINLLALWPPPSTVAAAPAIASPPPSATLPAPPAASKPLHVEVGLVQLVKARLSFADAANSEPFQTVLSPLDLEVKDFSTADNAKATYSFSLATEAGETVKLSGQFAVTPALAVDGDVEAAQILLKKYAPYYADKILFRIESGAVDLGTHYTATLNGQDLEARISAAHVALKSLKLVRNAEQEPFLLLPSFSVTGAAADLATREAVVEAVVTTGGEIAVQRLKSGAIDLQKLLPPPPAEVSGTPAAPAPAAAKPWGVTLKHFLLDRYAVKISDEMPEAPVALALDQVKIEVKNAATAEGAPNGSATVSMQINETGTLTSESTFTLSPLTAHTKLELKGFDLRPFQPYFTDRVKVILTSAQLAVGGVVDATLPAGGTPQIAYKGDVRLEGLGVVGKGDAEEIAKWNALEIDGIDAKLSPLSVDVAEVVLDKLALRIVINADGTINLTDLLAGQPASAAAPASTPAPAPAPSPAPAPAPAPAAAPLPVRLAKISFRDCQLAFVDHSLKPSFAMNVGSLNGVISGFALDGSQTGDIDLTGKIDNSGPVTITGKIKPVKDDLLVNIHFLLDAMELGGLTPYTGKFLGYKVARGKLSLDLHYNIVKRNLESTNTIFLDQFHLGDRVDSPTATNLPVNLALSLLRDRHGEIHLNVPVNGSFDDPKFRVFPIILQVLLNLVEKAVTSPFALLTGGGGGGGGGGGEELSYIAFDNGSSPLKESEINKLDTLAKALDNRPEIKVQMQGRADPVADRLALLQIAFDNKLKAQKLKELAAKGETMPDPAAVQILPEEHGRYLAKAYAEATFPRPPETPKAPSLQEMESLMKANLAVSDDDLRLLAYDRGLKVREYLMGKNVEARRLYVLEPKVAPAGENGKPGSVPAASTVFSIKLGKGGLPAAPDEKDDTPLVAPPVVVAGAVAAAAGAPASSTPPATAPAPSTTPPSKPGLFERMGHTVGGWF